MDDDQRINLEFGQQLLNALGLGDLRVASLEFEVRGANRAPMFKVGVLVTNRQGKKVLAAIEEQRFRLVRAEPPAPPTAA